MDIFYTILQSITFIGVGGEQVPCFGADIRVCETVFSTVPSASQKKMLS